MSVRSVRKYLSALVAVVVALLAYPALADDSRPYTSGNVLMVTSVLTKPGMFDEYMKWLAGPYRQQQEDLKKSGIVLDYSFYSADPRHPGDPDLYLVVSYKNLAALDKLDEQSEAIMKKSFGSLKQANEGQASRESMRTILGTEVIRKLELK